METYEKKYEEALERCREFYAKLGNKQLKEEVEDIFPELAESEDERMIKYFKDLAPFDKAEELYEKYGFSHKDAIAWLEKKCEQKSVKVPKFKVGDFIQFNGMGHTRYTVKEVCGLSHYINTCNKRMDMSYTDANFELVEQKPAELCENRSKELSLSLQIQAYLNTASDELYAKGKPIYSKERLEDIHKCMLMWQKLHNAYFYQNPAEWSEEDEMMIKFALTYFRKAGATEDSDIIKWLKSLRPQSHWKPSESQIFALESVIDSHPFANPRTKESLQDLVKQLKAL